MRRSIVIGSITLGFLAVAACAAPPAPQHEAKEETGHSEETLGEAGCGTANYVLSGYTPENCFNYGLDPGYRPEYWAVSGGACPDQSVYDVVASTGIVVPQVVPQSWPTTEASCDISLSTTVEVQYAAGAPWTTLGASTAPLDWQQNKVWDGSKYVEQWSCVRGASTGNAPTQIDLSRYTAVRVIGEAYVTAKGAKVSVPSQTNVMSQYCIW